MPQVPHSDGFRPLEKNEGSSGEKNHRQDQAILAFRHRRVRGVPHGTSQQRRVSSTSRPGRRTRDVPDREQR